MKLNEAQTEIVTTDKNRVLVVAGPGSGKTRVIIERIKYLLANGTPANQIVAITFTNFAAQEMMSRIETQSSELFIGTIHSYANKLLRESGYDTTDILMREDFAKLLSEATKIKNIPQVQYLLVDEFQDLCNDEFAFIKNTKPINFLAVGDDDQGIYGFKGSNIEIFYNLLADSTVTKYYLEENYRSSAEILTFAKNYLYNLKRRCNKKIISYSREKGDVIFLDYREAIDMILIEKDYSNWYILTRTNAELDAVANYLIELAIPYDTFKKGDLSYEEVNKLINSNTVKLLTVHSAKGLEAEKVIVIGINEWNDDERRIGFVAATRPKRLLCLCTKIKKPRKKSLSNKNNGLMTF